jgi:hypothetical protein
MAAVTDESRAVEVKKRTLAYLHIYDAIVIPVRGNLYMYDWNIRVFFGESKAFRN